MQNERSTINADARSLDSCRDRREAIAALPRRALGGTCAACASHARQPPFGGGRARWGVTALVRERLAAVRVSRLINFPIFFFPSLPPIVIAI